MEKLSRIEMEELKSRVFIVGSCALAAIISVGSILSVNALNTPINFEDVLSDNSKYIKSDTYNSVQVTPGYDIWKYKEYYAIATDSYTIAYRMDALNPKHKESLDVVSKKLSENILKPEDFLTEKLNNFTASDVDLYYKSDERLKHYYYLIDKNIKTDAMENMSTASAAIDKLFNYETIQDQLKAMIDNRTGKTYNRMLISFYVEYNGIIVRVLSHDTLDSKEIPKDFNKVSSKR